MDFSLGGLGWLLGNQLMWNNLVLLGGELHQFRGSPHYATRRVERSTIFLLAPIRLSLSNVPTVWYEKKMFHLLRDSKLPVPSLYLTVSTVSLLTVTLSVGLQTRDCSRFHLADPRHWQQPLITGNYTNVALFAHMVRGWRLLAFALWVWLKHAEPKPWSPGSVCLIPIRTQR